MAWCSESHPREHSLRGRLGRYRECATRSALVAAT